MEAVDQTPVPNGMVWNMVYDEQAPAGIMPNISHDELWQRLDAFLEAVLPVAEEEGVKLPRIRTTRLSPSCDKRRA